MDWPHYREDKNERGMSHEGNSSELKAAEGAHEREQLQDELDIITVAIKASELFERLENMIHNGLRRGGTNSSTD